MFCSPSFFLFLPPSLSFSLPHTHRLSFCISFSEVMRSSFCLKVLLGFDLLAYFKHKQTHTHTQKQKKIQPYTYILPSWNIPVGSYPKHSCDFFVKNTISGVLFLFFCYIVWVTPCATAKGLPVIMRQEKKNTSKNLLFLMHFSYESISRRVRGPWLGRACLRSYGVSWSSCREGATTVATFSFPRRSCEMWRTPSKEQPTSQLPTTCR